LKSATYSYKRLKGFKSFLNYFITDVLIEISPRKALLKVESTCPSDVTVILFVIKMKWLSVIMFEPDEVKNVS